MEERPLARSTISRDRFSRLFSIGDRNSPESYSPCLIIGENDPELPIAIAPLNLKLDNSVIPSTMEISTRAKLCYPFDREDTWTASQGLSLPPSLIESNSGEFPSGAEFLPVTWSSLHHDSSLLKTSFQPSIIALMDAQQLSKNSGLIESALFTIRTHFPSSLIWAPGISGPDNCALLSWMGVDIFDLARSRQASSLGVLLAESGPRLPEPSTKEDCSMVSQCKMWANSISSTRSAIRAGSLRELAELQSKSSSRSVEHLRRHDQLTLEKSGKLGMTQSSVQFGTQLRCHSFESRNDLTIRLWREEISENYEPPKGMREVLVLLPCSAKKPYRLSKSHSRFRKSIGNRRVHEIMITSPLGLVPRDLEDIWPAAHYDIPVTGNWDEDEISIIRKMLRRLVERVGYSSIINHSGIETGLVGKNEIDTRKGESAGSKDSLARLKDAVSSSFENESGELDFSPREEKLKSISRFKYGSDEWLDGCQIRGRPPIFTISKDGEQMAKWDPRRGRFLFSKASLKNLWSLGILRKVELIPGIEWTGDIFPNMIEDYDPSILLSDELAVIQEGELLGSARAVAPGWEWPFGPGKLAKSRHRL